jgi:hypothetical protein
MQNRLKEKTRLCGLPMFEKYAILLYKVDSFSCCRAGPDFDTLEEAFDYAEACCKCSRMYKEGWRMEVYDHEGEFHQRIMPLIACRRAA